FLSAKQGEETVGCVAFSVKDSSADISAISYDDDLFVCELLLRAVANYAERRGITQMTAAFYEPRGPLASLGFRLIDGQMTTAVSNVVHICKNCEEEGK
ncbi:MAG: hypothetical protein IJC18_04915, partial [Clostridia bacterium]|nr:hypothetical protein [Clostridia bacterium]